MMRTEDIVPLRNFQIPSHKSQRKPVYSPLCCSNKSNTKRHNMYEWIFFSEFSFTYFNLFIGQDIFWNVSSSISNLRINKIFI